MTKTLSQYPGLVNHLLTRAATRSANRAPHPQILRHIPRRHFQGPIPARPTAPTLDFAPTPGHARIEWLLPGQLTPAERRRRIRLHTILRLVIPLIFIAAVAFTVGCLLAITEASFTP